MKAFLSYPDRDFDPTFLLSRREHATYQRNKDPALDLPQALPWNHAALEEDLGLDILLNAMAASDQFLREAALIGLLGSVAEERTIRYRQDVLNDCLINRTVVREMYDVAVEALNGERKHRWISLGRYPASTLHHAVEVLEVFVTSLRKLRRLADQNVGRFKSEGFLRLFRMLQTELDDSYFAVVDRHLRQLKFRGGVLVSARLGRGNKPTGYMLRRPHDAEEGWIARLLGRSEGYTFHLHPRDEAGARALSELRDQGVNLVANALAQSMDHISSFFQMLRTELAFYVGCLNLHEAMQKLGVPTCFPEPLPAGRPVLSFSGLYDVGLGLSMTGRPVGNDLSAVGTGLLIVTGANTGGKSTFLRGIGLAQLMMQAGMFVGANAFSADLRSGIFTHYKREEDSAMESGKLDEELSRMREVVGRLQPGAMLLLNESFAATNEREGSEIARQIVTALVEREVKVCYVTHLHDFAGHLREKGLSNCIFLRAERLADGKRTFRIVEGDPLQTSYGEDVYEKVFGPELPATAPDQEVAFAD